LLCKLKFYVLIVHDIIVRTLLTDRPENLYRRAATRTIGPCQKRGYRCSIRVRVVHFGKQVPDHWFHRFHRFHYPYHEALLIGPMAIRLTLSSTSCTTSSDPDMKSTLNNPGNCALIPSQVVWILSISTWHVLWSSVSKIHILPEL